VIFAKLTPQAREAMVLAQKHADRLRHPWLGTEHLLLGLLRQPSTAGARALAALGVTAEAVERELVRELGEPSGQEVLGEEDERALRTIGIDLQEIRRRVEEDFGPGALERARPGRCGWPMTPRLKESLARANREAGRRLIGTDHLLLGMLGVRRALAVELLDRLGVAPDAVRASIRAQRAQAS
jgi:ATP-dependent Clp protease ATP-binding subunit ClpA